MISGIKITYGPGGPKVELGEIVFKWSAYLLVLGILVRHFVLKCGILKKAFEILNVCTKHHKMIVNKQFLNRKYFGFYWPVLNQIKAYSLNFHMNCSKLTARLKNNRFDQYSKYVLKNSPRFNLPGTSRNEPCFPCSPGCPGFPTNVYRMF